MSIDYFLMIPEESNPNNSGHSPVTSTITLPTPEGLNSIVFNPFRVVSWRVCDTPDFIGGYWDSIPSGLPGVISNVSTNKNIQ
jgi:hypothetical protein